MHTRELAAIGLRLIAFYLVARGIVVLAQSAPYLVAGAPASGQTIWHAVVAVQIIAPLLFGALIWVGAPWLASVLVRDRTSHLDMGGLSAESVAATAFGVAGVVILVYSLPQLMVSCVTAWELSRQDGVASTIQSPWLQLTAMAMRCVLAFGLAVGARRIGRWIIAARSAGLYREGR